MKSARWFSLLAVLGAGGWVALCGEDDEPSKSILPPPYATQSWVKTVATDGARAREVLESNPGWRAFYSRDYVEAAARFSSGTDRVARTGYTRSMAALAELDHALAKLLASAQAEYYRQRMETPSLRRLSLAPYYLGVAYAVLGDREKSERAFDSMKTDAGSHGVAAKVWLEVCSKQRIPSALSAWGSAVAKLGCKEQKQLISYSGTPAHAQLAGSWAERIKGYVSAVEGESDVALLRALASRPSAMERLEADSSAEPIEVEVEYYDALALRALGTAEDRLAVRAKTRNEPREAAPPDLNVLLAEQVFSPAVVSSEATAADPCRRDIDEIIASAVARWENDRASTHALVTELGLAEVEGDAILRREADTRMSCGDCAGALRLFEASLDIESPDRITFRNEPVFLVKLADAAFCARRMSSAVSALRTVATTYPEADGVLSVIRSLAIARTLAGGGYEGATSN